MATKWGTKEELVKLCSTAKAKGVGIYWDAVLNHRFAADHKEKCPAAEVDEEDRTKFISDTYDIKAVSLTAHIGILLPSSRTNIKVVQVGWI